jgi:MFS family permease
MKTQASPTAATEFAQGWSKLLGALLGLAIGVHSLPFNTSGLFMKGLQAEFGWTRTQISLGPTVLIAALGLAAPFVGGLIDRFGERRLIAPGLVVLALFFATMSQLSGSIYQFYAALALAGILAAGSATPTYTRIINGAFDKARGTALGIALIGTGLATAIAPPLLSLLIEAHGWRAGYLAIAIVIASLTPIILLLLGKTAPTQGDHPLKAEGHSVGQAVRDPTFWLLAAVFLGVALASNGLTVHFVPMLTDQGFSPEKAAALASGIGLFLIVGRLLTGVLIDRFFAPRVAAIIFLVSAAGFLVVVWGGARFALAGALAVGLSFGAEIDLIGYLTARYFGLKAYGRLYGLLYAVCLVGTGLSPFLYGVGFDHYGTYLPVLKVAALLLAMCGVLCLFMRRFPAMDGMKSARGARSVPSTGPSGDHPLTGRP